MGKFVIKPSGDQFMFNLKAGNGEIILTSERYTTKDACENGVESVRKNAATRGEEAFEKRTAKDGQTYFVMKATNGQEIGRSEMYKQEASADNGIASVLKNAVDAEIEDLC